ncbi:MAG: ATP-dependent Zn protease [Deltaproteobacteria bacterium]|nr:ATP-dependent Zn protease [Deltaproteobacteria bacterium]
MLSQKPKMSRRIIPLLVFLIMGVAGAVEAQEKVKIGLVEDVVIMPWKIRLPARIDTGAAVSSLDARDLKVIDNEVEFGLPSKYGRQKFRLPIVGWHTVRSAESKERRPIVEIELCIGPKLMRAKVNLNDRSRMKYPFLLGRNILMENFVVDCDRTYCAPPKCLEETNK